MPLNTPDPDHYQAIVIGSGQAGTPLCAALAEAGLRTALIERRYVGGTCVNDGCTPTKTMVASARVAYLARRAAGYGVHAEDIRIDMARVRQRKAEVVDRMRGGVLRHIEKTARLDLLVGEASFTGPRSVHVQLKGGGHRSLTGEKFFINAGSRPSVPALDGLKDVPSLDSTSIMELETVPRHLLVLGGGYVAIEFAQMFRRFGSAVTIVQAGGQLLEREDADVSREVAAILRQDEIEILLNATALRVRQTESQTQPQTQPQTASWIRMTVQVGDTIVERDGSHLLVATGRTPNTDSLNVPAAGVTTNEHGFIIVNSRLETSQAGIFALGDINGGPAFTHIAYDDFRILRTNLIGNGTATTEGRLVPYTVFMDPELGRVGLTETDARAQYAHIRIARMPMSAVARAREVDETRGFVKVVVDGETGHMLGAAVLGLEGGEVMSMLQLAMMGRLRDTDLRDAVFAHPTLAELLNNLFTHFSA